MNFIKVGTKSIQLIEKYFNHAPEELYLDEIKRGSFFIILLEIIQSFHGYRGVFRIV